MGQLAELHVPVPPINRQKQFALVAKRFTVLRAQQQEALRQAEQLFDTLLYKAFRGELSASDGEAVKALAAVPAGEADAARQMRLALE